MAGQTFYKDKPYVFVPIVEKVFQEEVSRQKILKDGYSGKLKITITAMSPLYFGQGELKKDKNGFVHMLTRESGQIVYPGSSFKGLLRSLFEAVSHSCILLKPASSDQIKIKSNQNNKCTNIDKLCPACSVFGAILSEKKGYKGKVNFTSFVTDEQVQTEERVIPELKSPFTSYPSKSFGNERLYYGEFEDIHGTDIANMDKDEFFHKLEDKKNNTNPIKFYGRKFYKHASQVVNGNDEAGCRYECLRKGTELVGYLSYEGLTKSELEILAFSLGLGWEKPIYFKLGYGKPAYFGSVSIKVESVEEALRYQIFLSHNNVQKHYNLEQLKELAHNYYINADPDVQAAIKAIQAIWDNTDGESQWKGEGNHLTY